VWKNQKSLYSPSPLCELEDAHHDDQDLPSKEHLLPSPLAGEGPGVRGVN